MAHWGTGISHVESPTCRGLSEANDVWCATVCLAAAQKRMRKANISPTSNTTFLRYATGDKIVDIILCIS